MAIRAYAILFAVLLPSALATRDAFALDNAARDRILASQTRLAAALMMKTPLDPMTGAVMVSPASLAGVLAPLTIAGDEAHRSAMAAVLQFAPSPTRLDDLDVIRATAAGTPGQGVETATRYVFAPRSPPTPEASRRLAEAGIDAIVAEPTSDEVRAENDAWVSKVTHGKITNVSPPPPDTVLAALNALYFKGRWAVPFEVSATAPADFHVDDGGRVRAPFMHSPPLLSASREDARFIAVDMPFAGARYAMVVLTTKDEPASLAGFADHLAWLDGEQFDARRFIVVDLPRFKATSQQDLLKALVGLGLDISQASSGLTAKPARLSEVDQTIKLDVDEKGAEVAVVTEAFEVVSGLVVSDVSEVVVDKPFAFALRDEQTGLVIASGFVSRVDGERLAEATSTKSARSLSVSANEDQERAEQRARAAAQGLAKVPASPNTLKARMRLEREF